MKSANNMVHFSSKISLNDFMRSAISGTLNNMSAKMCLSLDKYDIRMNESVVAAK